MAWLVAQIWFFLMIAFVIGAGVGVWAASARKHRHDDSPNRQSPATPASEPGILLAGPDGEKDDLTQIIGIDTVTETRLNALGVYHFRQVAAWSEGEARWIEIRLNEPGRVSRERWSEQAAAIA